MSNEIFTTPIQIRYADIDEGGHVNNATYLSYYELGRVSLMQKVLAAERIRPSFVLARLEINYLRRMQFGTSPICETWIEKLGNTSITFAARIMEGGEEISNCVAVGVYLGPDKNPSALTENIRTAFLPYVGRNE